MTPTAIIERVRVYGGDLRLLPDGQRFTIQRRSLIPDALAAEIKAHAEEVRETLRQQKVIEEAERIARSAAIRERRYPLHEPKVCAFHIGTAGTTCRRCGTSWEEHFQTREKRGRESGAA